MKDSNRSRAVGRTVLVVVTVVLLGALLDRRVASAGDDDLTARRHEWVAGAVEELHALADWCTSARLFAARARVYETVLLFDPDDGKARRWLRYRRGHDGDWGRAPHYVPPKDRGRQRPEFEKKIQAWRVAFLGEARALLEAAIAAGEMGLQSAILRTTLRIAPHDEGFRRANGEVRSNREGKTDWILVATQTGDRRRPALRKAAREAVDAVADPRRGSLVDADRRGDVPWGPVLQGRRVRVLGTTGAQEVRRQYDYCEATWPVFRSVFRLTAPVWKTDASYARGLTVYVVRSREAGNAFLSLQPGVSERSLDFVRPLVGAWIPGQAALVVKAPVPVIRLECGPKMILSGMCRRTFGITVNRAWASEGLAHYLTHLITGTRFICSVRDRKSRYAEPQPALPEYGVSTPNRDDWLLAGRDLLASEKKPDLFLMIGKDVNTITPDEVLYGYCIVAYLIEGRPDACVGFFRDVGQAETVDLEPIVKRRLGLDVSTFEARVLRWLDETTSRP